MIDKLLIASKNPKKSAELKQILEGFSIEVLDLNDVEFEDVEETGTTFAQNASLKAESACKATGLPVLADDSGLCVDALDGAPGVYTARYGGYEKLLDKMKDTPFAKRTAHFNCTLAYKEPEQNTVLFEGKIDGFILLEPRGEHGFAYDPIFLPEGQGLSFAEMTSAQKASMSHRGRALDQFIKHLKNQ